MAKLDLLGAGYLGRSQRLDASRMVNLYPEMGAQSGEPPTALIGTPGTKLFVRTGSGVIRGQHVFNGVMYIVSGNALYSVATDGTQSVQLGGNLQTSSGRVIISDNGATPTGGDQLIITDGSYTYIYYIGTSAWIEQDGLPSGGTTGSGIAWNGTVFCVVGSVAGSTAYTSPDGITWTARSLPLPAAAWRSIAWNGSVFCAISSDINGTRAATSPDGITWTDKPLPAAGATSAWWSIAALGSRFCVVTFNSNLAAWTVDNGATWNSATLPSVKNWSSITAAGGTTNLFCVISQNSDAAATSPDGNTWTARTLPSSGNWYSVASDGTGFLAVGAYPLAATSANGTTWVAQSLPISADGTQSVAWNGNIWMVLDYASAYCATSPDGVTWTTRDMPSSANWSSLTWNGTVFCAVSDTVAATSLYSVNYDGSNLVRTNTDIAAYTSCFIGGYFVVDMGGGQWRVSDLYEGLKWSALYQSTADASPDSLLSVFNNHGELWLFGEYTTEIYYQSGTGSPPFARVSGGVLDYGCAARYSVAKGANTVFWMATVKNNNQGEFIGVVAASGYTTSPIMPPPIVDQFNQYSDISDAWGYCYSENGHDFYVLTLPTAGKTWVYDITSGSWHERSYSALTGSPYTTGRHIGNTYEYFNGKHYLGSYLDGNIYEMSQEFVDDAGQPINSFRTFSYLRDNDSLNNVVFSKLEINALSGLNFDEDFCVVTDTAQESDFSADDGATWSTAAMPAADYKNVCSNGTVFCAVPDGTSDKAATSLDGATWTEQTLPSVDDWDFISWNGTVFCVVAAVGTKAATSPDGITWTARTLHTTDTWGGLVWVGDKFVLFPKSVGSFYYTSPDGITWTAVAYSGSTIIINDVVWNGKLLCAVGQVGGFGSAWVSSDKGATWTASALPSTTNAWNSIAWNGNVFCTVRTGSAQAAISTDGLTWTATTLPSSDNWSDIAWNGSVFCVVANGDTAASTSPDGTTWTARTLNNTNNTAITSWANKMIVPNSIYLSWSDDGGNTWTDDKEISLGGYGDNSKRAIWRQLGTARQRIFRVRISAAKKKVIVSANIEAQVGAH